MSCIEVDGFTFSLSKNSKRIYVFKGDALVTHQDYPTHKDAKGDFEKIGAYKKVVFATNESQSMPEAKQ